MNDAKKSELRIYSRDLRVYKKLMSHEDAVEQALANRERRQRRQRISTKIQNVMIEIDHIKTFDSVREARTMYTRSGQIISLCTIDHTGRDYLRALLIWSNEAESWECRVSNISAGNLRIDCDPIDLVRAICSGELNYKHTLSMRKMRKRAS